MRFRFTREAYLPKGAAKIMDKASDAVAFAYTTGTGRPAAVAFHGKAAKPDWHEVYRDELARERGITRFFEERRQAAARKAARRAEAAKPHGLEVGHVVVASWGYDQTNVSFYQVTAVIGPCMVEVRAIAQADASTGREPWATGKAMPALDHFTGVPLRRRVNGQRRSVRIDECRTAHVWDGRPQAWTAYPREGDRDYEHKSNLGCGRLDDGFRSEPGRRAIHRWHLDTKSGSLHAGGRDDRDRAEVADRRRAGLHVRRRGPVRSGRNLARAMFRRRREPPGNGRGDTDRREPARVGDRTEIGIYRRCSNGSASATAPKPVDDPWDAARWRADVDNIREGHALHAALIGTATRSAQGDSVEVTCTDRDLTNGRTTVVSHHAWAMSRQGDWEGDAGPLGSFGFPGRQDPTLVRQVALPCRANHMEEALRMLAPPARDDGPAPLACGWAPPGSGRRSLCRRAEALRAESER